MPDFNPNEMDALFREGADRHEFQYNPDAWALMEEKLDKKQSKRRVLFILLSLALLVVSLAVFAYFNNNEKFVKETIITIPHASAHENSQFEHILSNEKVIEVDITQGSLDAPITQDIKEEYITTDSKESSGNIGAQNSFQRESTGNLIGNEIVSIVSPSDARIATEYKQFNGSNISNDLSSKNETKASEKSEKTNMLNIPLLKNRDLEIFKTKKTALNSFGLIPKPSVHSPILLSSVNRFAATIFANPEWSSVGLFKESKAGWSVGTKFGYQFADKFEIGVGLAFSRKIYKGAGEAYTMAGGWFNDIEPMRMDAKCDVIEIPLALSYYVNGYKNSGFYADLGINSYMLHSEWYGFDYNDALVRPERYKEVIEEDANSHLVGVGRLAIGYQKVLSNNTSLQVAPYLQFPLTGIGAGQVNLYSSGVQIAVKFNTQ